MPVPSWLSNTTSHGPIHQRSSSTRVGRLLAAGALAERPAPHGAERSEAEHCMRQLARASAPPPLRPPLATLSRLCAVMLAVAKSRGLAPTTRALPRSFHAGAGRGGPPLAGAAVRLCCRAYTLLTGVLRWTGLAVWRWALPERSPGACPPVQARLRLSRTSLPPHLAGLTPRSRAAGSKRRSTMAPRPVRLFTPPPPLKGAAVLRMSSAPCGQIADSDVPCSRAREQCCEELLRLREVLSVLNPVLLSILTDSLARSSRKHLRVNSRCLIGKRGKGRRLCGGDSEVPRKQEVLLTSRYGILLSCFLAART